MLEALKIKNFQAHRKLTVRFDQITTFVGSGDVGKSSVVRALKWLTTNRPSGNTFITHGESQCVVKGKFEDVTVTRRRGRTNEYAIDDHVYKAVTTTVPEDVQSITGINPGAPVQLQEQHDAPFWLSLTSGQLAKELNVLVDLTLIDNISTHLISEQRRINAEVKAVDALVHKLEETDYNLAFVDAFEKDLEILETLSQEIVDMDTDAGDVQELVDDYNDARQKLDRMTEKFSDLESDFAVLERLEREVLSAETQADSLMKLMRRHRDCTKRSEVSEASLNDLREQLEAVVDTCPECGRPYSEDDQCQT